MDTDSWHAIEELLNLHVYTIPDSQDQVLGLSFGNYSNEFKCTCTCTVNTHTYIHTPMYICTRVLTSHILSHTHITHTHTHAHTHMHTYTHTYIQIFDPLL